MGAGKSVHKIDEGFFICGVDALRDVKYLKKLGIQCILNAAQDQLYKHAAPPKPDELPLTNLPKNFEVKIIGADDSPDCNLSLHFQEIADFIEAGRKAGGVVVHCAAGISRASTSCMAYMMIKEHWCLEAAFRKVHSVRNIIHPNEGFWRQLRDLEGSLRASGLELRPLPEDFVPPEQPCRPEEEQGKYSSSYEDTMKLLEQLERDITVKSFITRFLTARVLPKKGVKVAELCKALQALNSPGVEVEECFEDTEEEAVLLRAGLVHSMTHDGLEKLILKVEGVESAEVEWGKAFCAQQQHRSMRTPNRFCFYFECLESFPLTCPCDPRLLVWADMNALPASPRFFPVPGHIHFILVCCAPWHERSMQPPYFYQILAAYPLLAKNIVTGLKTDENCQKHMVLVYEGGLTFLACSDSQHSGFFGSFGTEDVSMDRTGGSSSSEPMGPKTGPWEAAQKHRKRSLWFW